MLGRAGFGRKFAGFLAWCVGFGAVRCVLGGEVLRELWVNVWEFVDCFSHVVRITKNYEEI